jgi:prepilin signal peptidase PulO-like enzyme (type II secretory pathway)
LILAVLLLAGRVKMGQAVPLGPALAWGGLVALFWGEWIISWYLSMLLL